MSDNFYSGMRGPVAIAKLNELWLMAGTVGTVSGDATAAATAAAAQATAAAYSAQASSTSATSSATSSNSASLSSTQAANQAAAAANQVTAAANQATAAATQATNSANSATLAATSATNSANSASAASTSATNSVLAAAAAGTSATAADTSADAATAQALSATNSATSATAQATQATNSAAAAALQSTNSAAQELAAATSASSALASKNTSLVQQAAAALQESNAQASQAAALISENLAQQWAIKTDGPVSAGEYSAKYWANYVTSTLSGQLQYKGPWDASGGIYPTTPTPVLGDYWRVSIGGTISGIPYTVNDQLVYNGTGWDKFDQVAGEGVPISLQGDVTGSGVTGGAINASLATQQKLDFNISTPAASSVGRMTWNTGEGTLDLGLLGGNVVLQIGQEQVQRVYNNTGNMLVDGKVVYITGAQGNRLTVALANNTSEVFSSKQFGILTESIANGTEGYVCTEGLVRNLDTSMYSEGSALWLHSTGGGLTSTKPVAPAHAVLIGYCIRQHATAGSILVKVQNGYEISELHDVLIVSPQEGDMLVYEGGLWKNKTPTQSRDILNVYSKTESDTFALSMAIALG